MSKMIEVVVEVVPTSGKPTIQTVEVPKGAKVSDVLTAAGVTAKDRNLTLNGGVVGVDAKIPTPAKAKLFVQERPAGS